MTDPAELARGDQVDAATRDTARILDGYRATLPGGGVEGRTPDRPPAWLAALAERHNRVIRSGVVYACPHRSPGHGPGVRCLVAWHPGAVVCPECLAAGVAMPEPGSVADRTCDGCSTFRPEGVRLTVVHLDPVTLFHIGLCDQCRADLDGAP